MEPRSPSKFKLAGLGFVQYRWALIISITLIVIMLLLVCIYGGIFRPEKDPYPLGGSYFTVVVDCGSTGTRVNVYEWLINGGNKWDLPILLHSYPDNTKKSPHSKDACHYHCMQTEPGLDKFVGNSSGLRASLEPLIIWAEQHIPPEKHEGTLLFVLATAGLRRLPIEDARLVLEGAESVVKEHSFMYMKSWIRVLSGKEEAYYGWLALNFKMRSLENSSKLSTLGLLDLGGSSLQVVMEIDNSTEDEHLVRSKVGLVEHRVLTHSLPAFGLNEAFDRTVCMLTQMQNMRKNAPGTFEVRHPCLSSGFMQNYTFSGCSGAKWENSGQNCSNLTSGYLVGDSNWEMCKRLAKAAAINSSSSDWSQLETSSTCKSRSDILDLTITPRPVARFHALSGFFAVSSMLNMSLRANLTEIWEKGHQLCSRSWADLSSISSNQNIAAQYCFRVPYLASLIEDALCLGDAEIYFGPGDVSWTMGAALVEGKALRFPEAQPRSLTPKISKVILSPIFLFVFLLFLLFLVYWSQIKLPMPGKKHAAVEPSLPSYNHQRRRTK